MDHKSARAHELGCCAGLMLMYVGGVVLLRNFPFEGEIRLTVLTRFRERAVRSFRSTDSMLEEIIV